MSFRALYVLDIEHRIIIFRRRFPNVERRYAAQLSQSSRFVSINDASDEALMESCLLALRGDLDEDPSAALIRLKDGPFIPCTAVKSVQKEGDGIVGPWIVSEAKRGVCQCVQPQRQNATQPGYKSSTSPNSKRRFQTDSSPSGSPIISSSSLPGSASSVGAMPPPQITVFQSPEEVKISEGHPRFAYKQNIVLIALPFCSLPLECSTAASDALWCKYSPTDVNVLSCWDTLLSSFHPLVDHLLLVAPPPPLVDISDTSTVLLQPHGFVGHAPTSCGSSSRSLQQAPRDTAVRMAPTSWTDHKIGSQYIHVVGGWSLTTTIRRVTSVFHWCHAMHVLCSTAMPFGTATVLLPRRHSTTGGVLHVRAERRVDASVRHLWSPSLEAEALLQSAEGGMEHQKLRGSEMMMVDSLRPRSDSVSSSSPSEQHGDQLAPVTLEFDESGDSRRVVKRTVPSRAQKMLRDYDRNALRIGALMKGKGSKAKQPNSGGASLIPFLSPLRRRDRIPENTAAGGQGLLLWNPSLRSSSCVTVKLVYEVAGQCYGANHKQHSSAATKAFHSCWKVTATAPSSPSVHWVQRIEDLCEHTEEGVSSIFLEDNFPLVVAFSHVEVPESTTTSAPLVSLDETVVQKVEVLPEVCGPFKTLPALGNKLKGTSIASYIDDPVSAINKSTASCVAQGGGTLDVVIANTCGLHQWAYQCTSAVPRAEDAPPPSIDLFTVTPALQERGVLPSQSTRDRASSVLGGSYSLTPVASPYAVDQVLSSLFGRSENPNHLRGDLVSPPQGSIGYCAPMAPKQNPTDGDFEHRQWFEGLLETPGHVLYRLELDVVLGHDLRTADDPHHRSNSSSSKGEEGGSSADSACGSADVLRMNAIIRFIDDVSIVSLHVLQSKTTDEHGVPVRGTSHKVADLSQLLVTSAATSAGGVAFEGAPSSGIDSSHSEHASSAFTLDSDDSPLSQIARDVLLWRCALPCQSTELRFGSHFVLSAFVVLDLSARSGALTLHSTLTSRNLHKSPSEMQQLVTVISSAEMDFAFQTVDPRLTGGALMIDPSIAGVILGTSSSHGAHIQQKLDLRASSIRTELASLHDAVQVGDVMGDVVRSERCVAHHRAGGAQMHQWFDEGTLVAAPVLVRNSPHGGFVFWNYAPSSA